MPSIKGTASIASNAAQNKLLRSTKFPSSFAKEVDLTKVNSAVMSQWIENKVQDILGFEDEIVASMANNLFFPKVNDDSASSISVSRNPDASAPVKYSKVDPRLVQLDLAGFLGDDEAAKFTTEVWEMFLDAQTQPKGIPKSLIEQKKAELGGNTASVPSGQGMPNSSNRDLSTRDNQARMSTTLQHNHNRPPQRRQPRDYDQRYRPPPPREWGSPRPHSPISLTRGGKYINRDDVKYEDRRRRGYSRSRSRSRSRSFHRHDDRSRARDRYQKGHEYSDESSEDSYGRRRRETARHPRHERKNRSHVDHRRRRSRTPRSWSRSRSISRSLSRSRSCDRSKGRYRSYNDSDSDSGYHSKRRRRSRSASHSRSRSSSRSTSSCASDRWRRRRSSSQSGGRSRHRNRERSSSYQDSRARIGSKRSRSSDRGFRRNRSGSSSPLRSDDRKRNASGKGRSRSHSYN